jgi:hypothetical protein
MTAASPPIAAAAAVALLATLSSACGDLSQEDLLFRAGVPQKSALAVVPPGIEDEVDDALSSSSQALSSRRQAVEERCEGDLLCETRNLARGFNGFTFFLLDIVDTISALPPTRRARGQRVWGPHFDAEKGSSFRFEMNRSDDGATFTFCLHAARGFVGRAPDVDCSVEDDADSGLQRILLGDFSPSGLVGAQARLGKGSMQLETERLNRLEGEPRFARVVEFIFDNTEGQTNIHIDMLDAAVDDEDRDAAYDFQRSADGDGTLAFDVFANLVPGGLFGEALERIRLRAAWTAELAGRAIGVVDGGNTGDNVFTVEQCWDAALATVYRKDVDDSSTGDVDLCVIDAPAVED